jgi:hypothetical protein
MSPDRDLTPEQRALYDEWLASGSPNPVFLIIREVKRTVRHGLAERLPPEVIRARILDLAERRIVAQSDAGQEWFLSMIGRAIDEALAELRSEG